MKRLLPDTASIRMNLSLGFPSLLAQISSAIVMIVFNMIILRLEGNTGVAAYGIIANLSLVVLSFIPESPGYSASRKRRLRQAGAETDRAVSPVCYGIHACSVGCHLSDLVCVCRSNRIGL